MIKVIYSSNEEKMKETTGGWFNDLAVAGVREYRFGGPRQERLPVITLDPGKKYQQVLGFGAALTDGTCLTLDKLGKERKQQVMHELFAPDALGFNIARLTVAQCDYGKYVYSYNDTPDDVEMKHFSIDYDRDCIIPTIKEALALNPDLFFLSAPWSPPGWMKTGGLITGGWMREKYLGAFAKYYLRYLQEYAKEGIRIRALTAQNEPETDQLGQMPACFWHPDLEMAFLKDHLAPLLRQNGLGDTQLWILDHNYALWKRAKWMLDDPSFKKIVHGVAFHMYQGQASDMSKLHDAHSDVGLYVTELGGGPSATIAGVGSMFIDMMKNWSKCIFSWNILLDERSQPHLGPFIPSDGVLGGAMMRLDSRTNELWYSASYHGLGHFSRFVKRDAYRIGCDCDLHEINCVAFANPNGELVVVLANPGAGTEASLVVKSRYAQVHIPAGSLCTLVFRG